ncbi:TIGR02221 family CRISPR-associated protein [Candidatus Parcubacteria bacterium]|nr:MAG: TIGR02221 family CRISPR-associated protein [Candidatus Parcubacteria bacterium]
MALQDSVIFDITNSFRSIPLLVFLAAAYLRATRDVTVCRVIYGAFEARDEANRSPVFDLTPFISLLNWLTATNQFIYTGDARYLAHLLTQEGKARNSSSLRTAGAKLDELSLAMMLCRPIEVMQKAGGLNRALAYAQNDLAQYTRPFALLVDRIEREYADRALSEPVQNVEENLRKQLALIHWYLGNNQVIQAMTLAREWVVTLTGWHLGQGFVLSRGDRETIEHGLGGIARMKRDGFTADDLNQVGRALWQEAETAAMLQKLWNDIIRVRNELNHAGMNPGPMKANKLVRKAREQIGPTLDKLARAWGLTRSGGNL